MLNLECEITRAMQWNGETKEILEKAIKSGVCIGPRVLEEIITSFMEKTIAYGTMMDSFSK